MIFDDYDDYESQSIMVKGGGDADEMECAFATDVVQLHRGDDDDEYDDSNDEYDDDDSNDDYNDDDDDDDDEMDYTFATDVVSGREKNWAEAENKLAEETRLRFSFDFL